MTLHENGVTRNAQNVATRSVFGLECRKKVRIYFYITIRTREKEVNATSRIIVVGVSLELIFSHRITGNVTIPKSN